MNTHLSVFICWSIANPPALSSLQISWLLTLINKHGPKVPVMQNRYVHRMSWISEWKIRYKPPHMYNTAKLRYSNQWALSNKFWLMQAGTIADIQSTRLYAFSLYIWSSTAIHIPKFSTCELILQPYARRTYSKSSHLVPEWNYSFGVKSSVSCAIANPRVLPFNTLGESTKRSPISNFTPLGERAEQVVATALYTRCRRITHTAHL